MTTDPVHRRLLRESSLGRHYYRIRYRILFYSLLVTMLMMPVVATIGLPASLMRLLIGASLLAAVMPSATRRTQLAFLAAIVALVVAQFVPEQGPWANTSAYVRASIGALGLLAAAGSLRFTVRANAVGSETVYAAVSTFLLAGLFLGQIYWCIESFHPGSITGPDPLSELNAGYFSFVTLTTLGYGDFIPRTALTRGLATFEAVGGQLFLAVLVARFIGAFVPAEP